MPGSHVACHREYPPSPQRLWRTRWHPWLRRVPPRLRQRLRRGEQRLDPPVADCPAASFVAELCRTSTAGCFTAETQRSQRQIKINLYFNNKKSFFRVLCASSEAGGETIFSAYNFLVTIKSTRTDNASFFPLRGCSALTAPSAKRRAVFFAFSRPCTAT